MKMQSQVFFNQISKATVSSLTNTTEETLAKDNGQRRTFSAAELWNIQRRRRLIVIR